MLTKEQLIIVNKFGLAHRLAHEYLVLLEGTGKFRVKQIYNRALKANDQLINELDKLATKETFEAEGIMAQFMNVAIDLLMLVAMSRNEELYQDILDTIGEKIMEKANGSTTLSNKD